MDVRDTIIAGVVELVSMSVDFSKIKNHRVVSRNSCKYIKLTLRERSKGISLSYGS